MGRPAGILRFEGTLDQVSSYRSVYGDIIRRKGGASKEKIKNDPSLVRIRENNTEFAFAVKTAQLLKLAVRPLLPTEKDHTLAGRMNKLMIQLKNEDGSSERGQRRPGVGLKTPGGLKLLRGFEFNSVTRVHDLLRVAYQVDPISGSIIFPALDLQKDIRWPAGATHVQLQGGLVNVDLDERSFDTQVSPIVTHPQGGGVINVELRLASKAAGSGVQIFLLTIGFVQVVNGALFRLKNRNFNGLAIVEVI